MAGFNRTYPVDTLLTDLMGLETGTWVCRADAQRAICKHVRDNNLVDPRNRFNYNLDQTLKTLLQSEGPLTYDRMVMKMQWLFPTKENARRIREEVIGSPKCEQ
jgi:chromatin remodeling complex protein RSC6